MQLFIYIVVNDVIRRNENFDEFRRNDKFAILLWAMNRNPQNEISQNFCALIFFRRNYLLIYPSKQELLTISYREYMKLGSAPKTFLEFLRIYDNDSSEINSLIVLGQFYQAFCFPSFPHFPSRLHPFLHPLSPLNSSTTCFKGAFQSITSWHRRN